MKIAFRDSHTSASTRFSSNFFFVLWQTLAFFCGHGRVLAPRCNWLYLGQILNQAVEFVSLSSVRITSALVDLSGEATRSYMPLMHGYFGPGSPETVKSVESWLHIF